MVDQVAVRLAVVGGTQFKTDLVQAGVAGEQMGARISRGARAGSSGLANLGFQVQDFAVQVGAGTSASQALAQQLPQLLSGFGLLGVAIGTTTAIAIPLASYFFSAGEEAGAAAKKVDALAESVKRLKQVNESFSFTAIDGLIEKYGELDAAVLLLVSRQQQLAEAEALAAARGVASGLGGELDGLVRSVEGYDRTLKVISEATARGEEVRQGRLIALQEELNQRFGVTVAQAQAIRDALSDLNSGGSPSEAADAAARLNGLLQQSVFSSSEFRGELLSVEDQLRQLNAAGEGIGGWLGAAITGAGDLAAGFLQAARAALSIPQFTPGKLDGGPDAARARAQFGQVTFNGQVLTPAVKGAGLPSPVVLRGGRGGGGVDPVEREAKKLFDETRTAAEKYAAEQKKLNDLYKTGAIDADTYARAQKQLKEKFQETGSFMSSVGGAVKSSLGSLFDGIVEGGTSAGEVLEDLAKKLASLALQNSAFQLLAGLAPNIFGAGGSIPLVANAMGNAFRNGQVTAFAAGGVVSRPTLFGMRSGMGLMGEAGPEGILPLTRVGGKLGVSAAGAGGGTSVEVHNYGGSPARTERTRGPDGREVVKVIVGEEMSRGSFDGSMKSRYGNRPDKVRR